MRVRKKKERGGGGGGERVKRRRKELLRADIQRLEEVHVGAKYGKDKNEIFFIGRYQDKVKMKRDSRILI